MSDINRRKGKKVSRRDFLKGFGTGALGAAVTPRLLSHEAYSLQQAEGELSFVSRKKITLTVNKRKYNLEVEPRETLLEVLRNRLGLTGTKSICGQGECGGCTVHLDGLPVYSCLTLAVCAHKKEITTVEGLARGEKLHPIQEAFIEKDGYQCGFCTPGFIMTSAALLEKKPDPGREEIKQALSGNLCRCGNYTKIFEAVEAAARKMRRP